MEILDRYLEFVKHSEAPTQYHRWSFISAVGAALSRNVGLPFGHGHIWPNNYVVLVGATGTRKSSAISIAKNILADAGYRTFTPNKTTKAKFLLDMQDGFDIQAAAVGTWSLLDALDEKITVPPIHEQMREAYIVADEFVDFIGVGNYDFLTALTTLWDCLPFYTDRIKNTQSVTIPRPTVSLLGGATPANLQKALPTEIQGHGFLSRSLFVYCEPTGIKITFPKPPNESERLFFVEFFEKVQKLKGTATLDAQAEQAIDDIYHRWTNSLDIRFDDYASRRLVHLIKLCMICAAMRLSTEVKFDDVVAANTILLYTEAFMPRALGEFGMARSSQVMQKVMTVLERHDGPLKMEDLFKELATDIERSSDFVGIIATMKAARKIKTLGDSITIAKVEHVDFGKLVDYKRYIREFEFDPYLEGGEHDAHSRSAKD